MKSSSWSLGGGGLFPHQKDPLPPLGRTDAGRPAADARQPSASRGLGARATVFTQLGHADATRSAGPLCTPALCPSASWGRGHWSLPGSGARTVPSRLSPTARLPSAPRGLGARAPLHARLRCADAVILYMTLPQKRSLGRGGLYPLLKPPHTESSSWSLGGGGLFPLKRPPPPTWAHWRLPAGQPPLHAGPLPCVGWGAGPVLARLGHADSAQPLPPAARRPSAPRGLGAQAPLILYMTLPQKRALGGGGLCPLLKPPPPNGVLFFFFRGWRPLSPSKRPPTPPRVHGRRPASRRCTPALCLSRARGAATVFTQLGRADATRSAGPLCTPPLCPSASWGRGHWSLPGSGARTVPSRLSPAARRPSAPRGLGARAPLPARLRCADSVILYMTLPQKRSLGRGGLYPLLKPPHTESSSSS